MQRVAAAALSEEPDRRGVQRSMAVELLHIGVAAHMSGHTRRGRGHRLGEAWPIVQLDEHASRAACSVSADTIASMSEPLIRRRLRSAVASRPSAARNETVSNSSTQRRQ
jgi:hypothetical protein